MIDKNTFLNIFPQAIQLISIKLKLQQLKPKQDNSIEKKIIKIIVKKLTTSAGQF